MKQKLSKVKITKIFCLCKQNNATYFSALYIGLYHNTNEQGIKSTRYNIETPNNVAPLSTPTITPENPQMKLKHSENTYTKIKMQVMKIE